MKRATKEGIQVSIGLHLAAVGVVVLMAMLATFFEEEPPVVFELVDLSAASGAFDPVPAPQTESPVLPEPDPLPPVEALQVPSFDDLRPAPELPPERVVEPVVQPAPRPVVQPEPAPEPPPQRLSYEDHLNTFGRPEVTRAAPRDRVPDVRIETNARDTLRNTERASLVVGSTAPTAAQRDILMSYVDSLAARLQAAFNPLGTNGLVALVEFTVQADGTISPVRIKRSSGNEAFDRSVLTVFQRIRRYTAPPDGKSHTWEINFRSVE